MLFRSVLYTYDPSIHDYSEDKPEFVCVGHDHYVYGNKKEIQEYKAVRDGGVPLKPIKILAPGEVAEKREKPEDPAAAREEEMMVHPTRDTGSIWYKIFSFILPLLGLIAMAVFNHFHHFRNARACKKGAVAGLLFLAAILLLFLLLIVLAVI